MESENFRIPRSVISGGGSFVSSDSYALNSTIGQAAAIGASSSLSFDQQAGFWFSILMIGDVNGDGRIDLSDLVLSLQLMAGIGGSDVLAQADVNGDGQIGLSEALYILGKLAGVRD
jgi:hypothetical protein